MVFNVYILLISLAIGLIMMRVFYVLYWSSKPPHTKSIQPLSTLIVLGSGGHTAEMLNLLSVMHTDRFTPRFYIAATTDNMSLQKARLFENSLADKTGMVQDAQFMQIYRSREVGQSYLTSVGTTLIAIAHALWLMIKMRPQVVVLCISIYLCSVEQVTKLNCSQFSLPFSFPLQKSLNHIILQILCNGPGTCVPLCIIAFIFKVMGIRWSSTFYVESIARVRRLSLSGLILYKLHMADHLFVQWPQLQRKYPRAHYVGCLM